MVKKMLIFLHVFIGIGAMAGGISAILNPYSPMPGMGVDILNGYFDSFMIPGLFLFLVIGAGNLLCALIFLRFSKNIKPTLRRNIQGCSSGFIGAVLFLWIVIQCIILHSVVALHIIFGTLGIIQGILALVILYKKDN